MKSKMTLDEQAEELIRELFPPDVIANVVERRRRAEQSSLMDEPKDASPGDA